MSQARDGIKAQINENPAIIKLHRQALVDDGFGGQVPDPLGEADLIPAKVRIAHEKANVPNLSESPIGMSTNLARFILADYKTEIKEGDRFNYIGYGWEIGFVDPLISGKQIIGYQAPLKMADPFPEPYVEDDEEEEEDEEDEIAE